MGLVNIIGNIIGSGGIGEQTGQDVANLFATRVAADGGITEALTCQGDQIQHLKNLGFWNSASFILTPTGYMESKLYSVKPDTGAGDFAFVRATTATRKGPSLIEDVPWNFSSRSESFDNAFWTKSNSSVVANSVTAPNGTLTADTLLEAATPTTHVVHWATSKSSSGTQRLSCYIKPNGRDWFRLLIGDGTGFANAAGKYFNVTTGVAGQTSTLGSGWSLVSHAIEPAANGFYKLSIVVAGTIGSALNIGIFTADADGSASFLGDVTKGGYIWQAQVVEGATAFPDFTTTDRFNVPRPDYTKGSCPALLLEPARTNLCLRSEEFDTATWVKNNLTAAANITASPDGNTTADRILETAVTNLHFVQQVFTKSASALTYTFSVYAKGISRDWIAISVGDGSGNGQQKFINISTGALGTTKVIGSGFTFVEATATLIANGFYRISICVTTNTSTGLTANILGATADNVDSYLGDVAKGYYVWGVQLTQHATKYQTSYIPTTTASVTKNADAPTEITGASALIGQTEGTLFLQASSFADSTENKAVSISDGLESTRISITFLSTNLLRLDIKKADIVQADISNGGFTSETVYKIAVTYKTNKAALFINGSKIGEDLTVDVPACNTVRFARGDNAHPFNGNVKMLGLWKTAFSDADAQTLTT